MIVTRTPLRVSFFGGSTDIKSFYEKISYGSVLSCAIDKYIYVVVHERIDKKIRVIYNSTELVEDIEQLNHNRAKACLKEVGINSGIEIASFHDIPSENGGFGLGASSSYTVGLLKALYKFKNENVSNEEIARIACEIEMNVLQEPIGKQDQYAAAVGGLNHIEFYYDELVKIYPIKINNNISNMINHLFLVYVGKHRTNFASDILKDVSNNININYTDMIKLRDYSDLMYLDLLRDDTSNFNSRLNENWIYKKKTSNFITNEHINKVVDFIKNFGANSAKLLGAGGGGYILVYGPDNNEFARKLSSELNTSYINFNIDMQGSVILYA